MAKVIKVLDESLLEETVTQLEKEGYKEFYFFHTSQLNDVVREDLPETHPQRVLKQHVPAIQIIATGKKGAK